MALVAKNKLCFVDRSTIQPLIDDLVCGLWSTCNSMSMSWICHSILKDIEKSIMNLDSVVDMWNDLFDRFHQGNSPRVFKSSSYLAILFKVLVMLVDTLLD